MIAPPGAGPEKASGSVPTQRRLVSTGTALVLGLGLVLLAGWLAYQPLIPPAWLHGLAADIALRASVDPDAPPPEDTRQATPRGFADAPYICMTKFVDKPWDLLIAVTAKQGMHAHPILSDAQWPMVSLASMTAQMERDDRYQLLVLLKNNTVVDAQLFFTFWGTLEGIARPQGFTPNEAIFTAASKGGIYEVAQAVNPPANACR